MFLATTAHEEFWDIQHNRIVLAGEWCRLYSNARSAQMECIPYLWENVENVYEAQKYCNTVYEEVLVSLTQSLNDYLGVNNDPHYYRIMLGNWLIHFIHQAYDKYLLFKSAIEYGIKNTWVLDPAQYYYPSDVIDYFERCESDLYQLQLYSEIAQYVNIDLEYKQAKLPLQKKQINNRIRLRLEVKKSINKGLVFLQTKFAKVVNGGQYILIVNPYFKRHSRLYKLRLWIQAKGDIIFDSFDYKIERESILTDLKFRNKKNKNPHNFKEFILQIALSNIPKDYLECHHEYLKLVKNINVEKVNAVFTYNALYNNIILQYYLALNYKKLKILSAQHGCAYGMDKRHEGEVFERSISNRFYTYGWTESKQTIPLPMPRLLKDIKTYKLHQQILFVTTSRPRFTPRFVQGPCSTKMLTDHVEYPLRFFKQLNYMKYIVVRHHPSHDIKKWYNRQRIKAKIPDIVEDPNRVFYDSLEQSRVFVSDHLGTTFLEAMQANVPTIIIINRSSYLFRTRFNQHIEKLIKGKIIFFDPEKAAIHLNAVYSNIDKWWENKNIQNIKAEFVREYSLTTDNWMDEWCRILSSFR